MRPEIQIGCQGVQIPVSVSINALQNDYAHSSLPIFTKFCIRLRNVVASTPIVCETNRKQFSDFRGEQIHILAVLGSAEHGFHSPRNARISRCKRCISYSNSVCLSVRPSVCLSVCPSHAGIVSKPRHVARCSLHCWIAKCVQFCRNQKIFPMDDPFPLKFWLQVT